MAKMNIEAIVQALRQKALWDTQKYPWYPHMTKDEVSKDMKEHICWRAADLIESFKKE